MKKWKGKNAHLVDEVNRFFIDEKDLKKDTKLDMKVVNHFNFILQVKKNTYVEQLIRDNTRKKYPRPGPGAHFLSIKSIKMLPEEKRDILISRKVKEMTKKNSSDLAARNFHLVENPKDLKLFPGPGKYHPHVRKTILNFKETC